MKKLLKFTMILLMLVGVMGCSSDAKKEDETTKPTNVLAGKQFFNVNAGEISNRHSYIKFYEDNTFEMDEYYIEGTVGFKGTYTIEDKTLRLQVKEVGLGDYDEVIFNIKNENALSLQTDLFESSVGNVYVCCESVHELDKASQELRTNIKDIIADTIFYNTIDRYANTDTSYVTFKSDTTFEMKEHYHEEYVTISGTWDVKGDYINCAVEQSGAGDFKEIKFFISDFEELYIETDLFSSKIEDLFTTEKPYLVIPTVDYFQGNFINASQKARGDFSISNIELRSDGTFTLNEIDGMGVTQISGLFGQELDYLMFSNFDGPIYNYADEEIQNFEFRIIDNNTLELNRQLQGSRAGDYFTTSGQLPAGYTPVQEENQATYIHEPIQDVNDDYLPRVELKDDGTFVFLENCYAGMGKYLGNYTKAGTLVVLEVTDNSSMQGFMGADVTQIVLEQSSHGYTLKTNLCMSCEGDEFILQ